MCLNGVVHTDIRSNSFIEKLPQEWRSYALLARIDRPIGIWLLLLPSLWAIVLAPLETSGDWLSKVWIALLFAIGAAVMRGAGCVINDLWDRDLDAQVERTKARPLASGAISIKNALLFLLALLLCGVVILFQFNAATITLGFAVVPLIVLYPMMKRLTFWPQAFLAATFNFGALMGWAAVTGKIGVEAVYLYIAAFFWTLAYDTIYAHQDREDDALIGVKSTALLFGRSSKIWVAGFYAVVVKFLALALGSAVGPLYAALALLPALHFVWQIMRWNMDSQSSALKIFKSNRDAGLLVLFVLLFMQFFLKDS